MSIVHNFPFFSILLCMSAGILTSMLNHRAAKWVTFFVSGAVLVMSIFTLNLTTSLENSYSFMMGHFPAPWGNEIRIGRLEALAATGFSAVLFLSVIAGFYHSPTFVSEQKTNLYCIMIDLALAAVLVLIYTNDLFTVYVFIEIMTIASCALVLVRQNGHTLVAITRYMIMHLFGSGLLLLGISMLYGITGHLLMEPLHDTIQGLVEKGQYTDPLVVVIALITAGLGIKSAMFPFHGWAPDTYAFAPPVSSALLSGIIGKSYIFILIKFYYRVIGIDFIISQDMTFYLFYCGIAGMMVGSIFAIFQRDIRRMVAYSSVAQIGYIYMGIGMGTAAGVEAAVFQMLVHSVVKSLLFLSTHELVNVSGDRKRFHFLHGAGYRNVPAGIAFTFASLSMVGIPFTGGFIVKLNLAIAGMNFVGTMRALVLIALAVSTLLNAVYFLHTVVSIYRKPPADIVYPEKEKMPRYVAAALGVSALLIFLLGVVSEPVMKIIEKGLQTFA
ncbi:MAG: proton-conducting transporter membrane subunit [Bacillota bacterium]|nr:proton-conducting transporter membrane subunit [Bacillota bacterium]